ncbi:hypothetical protein [Escherichia coli]
MLSCLSVCILYFSLSGVVHYDHLPIQSKKLHFSNCYHNNQHRNSLHN